MNATVRVTSFSIRAELAASTSAGSNLSLVIAYGVLAAIGFFGLIYSAYTLIVDRCVPSPTLSPQWFSPAGQAAAPRQRHATRAAHAHLPAAAVRAAVPHRRDRARDCGEQSGVLHEQQYARDVEDAARGERVHVPRHDRSRRAPGRADGDRRGQLYVAAVARQLRTVLTSGSPAGPPRSTGPFGARHGTFVLTPLVLVLLVREAFAAITLHNAAQADDEGLWYPFSALPELLAVLLFAVPGLVPDRAEMTEVTEMQGMQKGYAV
jgi:hypothetical protein